MSAAATWRADYSSLWQPRRSQACFASPAFFQNLGLRTAVKLGGLCPSLGLRMLICCRCARCSSLKPPFLHAAILLGVCRRGVTQLDENTVAPHRQVRKISNRPAASLPQQGDGGTVPRITSTNLLVRLDSRVLFSEAWARNAERGNQSETLLMLMCWLGAHTRTWGICNQAQLVANRPATPWAWGGVVLACCSKWKRLTAQACLLGVRA